MKVFPYIAMPIITVCAMIILNLYGMNVPDLAEVEIHKLADRYQKVEKVKIAELTNSLPLDKIPWEKMPWKKAEPEVEKEPTEFRKLFAESESTPATTEAATETTVAVTKPGEPEPQPADQTEPELEIAAATEPKVEAIPEPKVNPEVETVAALPEPKTEPETTSEPVEEPEVVAIAAASTEPAAPTESELPAEVKATPKPEPKPAPPIIAAYEPITPLIIPAAISSLLSRAPVDIPEQTEVQFRFNSSSLSTPALATIEDVVNALQDEPLLGIQVRGYADSLGDASYNDKLSRSRSIRVRETLVERGIDPARIEVFPFGSSLSPQGPSANHRRVDLIFYEL